MTKELQMIIAAAAVFLVISGGMLYWRMNLSDEIAIQDGQIAQLNKKIAEADKEIAKKPGLEEEQRKLDKHLNRYVSILPPPEVASREWFLRMVNDKLQSSDLGAKSVVFVEPRRAAPSKKKSSKADTSAFEEIKVDLEAEGTYDQFLRFLNSIERNETFLRVNTFDCRLAEEEPVADGEGKLVWKLAIRLQISTFRYTAKPSKKKGK